MKICFLYTYIYFILHTYILKFVRRIWEKYGEISLINGARFNGTSSSRKFLMKNSLTKSRIIKIPAAEINPIFQLMTLKVQYQLLFWTHVCINEMEYVFQRNNRKLIGL